MKKIFSKIIIGLLVVIGAMVGLILLLILFICISPWLCPSLWGSYSLGKNLYMVTEDHCFYHDDKRYQGYMILQGTDMEGRVCHGGENVVPTYENHYDSVGNYREFVTESKHNEDWIVVKSYLIPEKRFKYYIIRKDFDESLPAEEIVSKHVKEYDTYHSFIVACKTFSIDIEL